MKNILLEPRKKRSCYIVGEGLTKLYCTIIWKAELISELGYFSEAIPKQSA